MDWFADVGRRLAAGTLLAVLLAACSASGAPSSATSGAGQPTGQPSAGTSAPNTVPAVTDAWIRPPMGPDRPAGGYLAITGRAIDDALTGAASPVAGRVELHETTADASGMTGMQHVDRVAIPAGATVMLEPGGYHLMLMDLRETLEPGATVEITLTFEGAGAVTVEAEIRPAQ